MGSHPLVVIRHTVDNSKRRPRDSKTLPVPMCSMCVSPPSLTLTVELLPPSRFHSGILLTSSLVEGRLSHCPLIPRQSDSHLSVTTPTSLIQSLKTTRSYSCKHFIE